MGPPFPNPPVSLSLNRYSKCMWLVCCLQYVGVANCSCDCFLVLRRRRQSSSCSTCVLSPTTSPFGWSSRSSRPTQYWRRSVGPHQVVYTHTSHYRPITLHTPYYRSPSHCIHLIVGPHHII